MEEKNQQINSKTAEVDILYQLLRQYGQGQSFRELMLQVCDIKGVPADNPNLLSAVHTQINLDNRFSFLGQGSLGLREWSQGKIVRRNLTAATSSGRNVPFQRRTWQDDLDDGGGEYNTSKAENNAPGDDAWEE